MARIRRLDLETDQVLAAGSSHLDRCPLRKQTPSDMCRYRTLSEMIVIRPRMLISGLSELPERDHRHTC
jgi:hypothetical protein